MKDQSNHFSNQKGNFEDGLVGQNLLFTNQISIYPNQVSKLTGEKSKSFSTGFKVAFTIIVFAVLIVIAYGYNQGGVFR